MAPFAWKTASKDWGEVGSAVMDQEAEYPGPAPAGYQSRQRGEPHPVSGLVPHPPGVPAQHRVLVPEHQQLSILSQVPAEYQDGEGGYTADYQVDDLERHPASQPSPHPGRR
jgi:hypothetical protein